MSHKAYAISAEEFALGRLAVVEAESIISILSQTPSLSRAAKIKTIEYLYAQILHTLDPLNKRRLRKSYIVAELMKPILKQIR